MLNWTILPLLLVTLGELSPMSSVHESVDLIELNHFHDDSGRRVYDQVIFYEWCEAANQYHVRAWCLVERSNLTTRRPTTSHADRRYHVRWYDPDQRLRRHITSDLFRETWTQTDPERLNKLLLNERDRTALYRPVLPRQNQTFDRAANSAVAAQLPAAAIEDHAAADPIPAAIQTPTAAVHSSAGAAAELSAPAHGAESASLASVVSPTLQR